MFLGLARDSWRPFDDYAKVEDGRRSTFFLVPFKRRPGVAPDGTVDPRRAVAYDVSEIGEEVKQAAATGQRARASTESTPGATPRPAGRR